MKASEEDWVNSQTMKARVVRYVTIQSPQWVSELTHSSSEASIYDEVFINLVISSKSMKEFSMNLKIWAPILFLGV